jgi:hypothetical protein
MARPTIDNPMRALVVLNVRGAGVNHFSIRGTNFDPSATAEVTVPPNTWDVIKTKFKNAQVLRVTVRKHHLAKILPPTDDDIGQITVVVTNNPPTGPEASPPTPVDALVIDDVN